MSARPEYGARGLLGLAVPQANTTAEAELAVLCPQDIALATARLTCPSQDSRERLVGYWKGLAGTLAQFDTAPLDAVAFACTGSSYLLDPGEEEAALAKLPVPVFTAAGAVRAALGALGARRIALVSPYPEWLTQACMGHWRRHGIEVARVEIPAGDRTDTRRIYALGTPEAAAALERVADAGVDAILVTGTGMPTLGALYRSRPRLPVLASNLCLAWQSTQALRASRLEEWIGPEAPWRGRYAARYPSLA